MSREGVDYAFTHVNPVELARAGKSFACRYGGPGTADKHLTAGEAYGLNRAGLNIVALCEGAAHPSNMGYTLGRAHAVAAQSHFSALGMPGDRPIYFAVDWDVTTTDWPAVKDYLLGASSVVGYARTGVYGSYNTVHWADRDRAARWFFQTYAWSHGQWRGLPGMEQYRNGVDLAGGQVDLCRATSTDFGQWAYTGSKPTSSSGGGNVTVADEVWAHPVNAVSLGMNAPAGEFLKYTVDAYRSAARAVTQLELVATAEDVLSVRDTVDALRTDLAALGVKVDRLIDTPVVDAVAVADAIAARPEIARAIAEAVAAQLATITGSITLSGSLSGRIATPTD